MSPSAEQPYVVPEYIGGPFDGGLGAIEPYGSTLGTIRLSGGRYSLQGFRLARECVADGLLSQVTPDRAVYLWEVGE